MRQLYRKSYRNFGFTSTPTSRHITQILPQVLSEIGRKYQDRPDLIVAFWPQIIGEQLASQARAVCFDNGFLVVKVSNSTLYSLLSTTDKPRLIKRLRERFPQVTIKSIVFKLG